MRTTASDAVVRTQKAFQVPAIAWRAEGMADCALQQRSAVAMQQAEQSRRTSGSTPEQRRFVSPLVAFAILAVIIAAASLIIGIVGKRYPTTTVVNEPKRAAQTNLTEEEAVARFRSLNDLRITAYEQRDLTLVPLYVSRESDLFKVNLSEIRRLLRDDVVFESNYREKRVRVVENTNSRVVVRVVALHRPRFRTEGGKDVSRVRTSIVETTDWTLKLDDGTWKIYDAKLVASRRKPR